jgi:predicted dehydrogenase
MPATGYGPIKGHTHKGEIDQPTVIHQTVQMDAFAGILLEGQQPPVPVDGAEAVKDLKIIDAIYQSARTGQKILLSL